VDRSARGSRQLQEEMIGPLFIGLHGVSLAAKRVDARLTLGCLFLTVRQLPGDLSW